MLKQLRLVLCIIVMHTAGATYSQVSITSLGSAYTQNFNSLSSSASATWTDNSTISNWYAAKTSSGALSTITIGTGSSTTGAFYNFGSSSSTDRALGSVNSSTTRHIHYGLRMKNNTSSTITAFYITFTGEQWSNRNSAAQTMTFSYRTSSSSITNLSGTFTNVSALNFVSPVKGGTYGAIDGNATANRVTYSYLLTGISLPAGSEIMFRWYDKNHKGTDHALAIDDVSISAVSTTTYYSKASGNLNLTTSWGVNSDGSGTNPSNFTNGNTVYYIKNSSTKTIGANWTVSGTGSKVVLDNGGSAVNFTIPSNYTYTGSIDLGANSTLTLNTSTLPNIGSMASSSTIIFSSVSSVPSGDYYNLTISGSSTQSLTGNVSVSGTLTLNTKLNLGAYDLTINSGGSISGSSSSNYIIAGGAGSLIQEVPGNNTNVVFPVGLNSSYYNPVILRLTNASTTDNFSVNLLDKIYTTYDADGIPSGSEITTKAVGRTYYIEEETEGGSNATITLQWSPGEEKTDFTRNSCTIAHFTGGAWVLGTKSGYTANGGFNTRSISGVTSFSPFGIGGNNTVLPVELVSFTAEREDEKVLLKWITAQETDNDYFMVQKSSDGINFTDLKKIEGVHNSVTDHTYNATDKVSLFDMAYYRLNQVDYNGRNEYSPIVKITMKNTGDDGSFQSVYPNPFADELHLTFNGISAGEMQITLMDVNGNTVYAESRIMSQGLENIRINTLPLPAGIYFVKMTNGNISFIKKIVKQSN